MRSKRDISLPGIMLTLAFAITNLGCGGGSAANGPQLQTITLSLTTPSAVVQVGAAMAFAVSVNPPEAETINWSLSCSASPCGSLSQTTPASTWTETYTAPTTLPASNLRVTLTATLASDPTVSASAIITVPSVAVTIAPVSATVESGGTQQFVATLVGDSTNGGVMWSLQKAYSCPRLFVCGGNSFSCDSSCGSISPPNSGNGTPMTYTAPATPPSFPPHSSNGHLVLVASSVADNIATTSVPITLLPISVTVSPGATGVALNGTQQITATVVNDGANNGVTWNLTQNGGACAPGCGTIAPTTAATGAPATYTAPATALAFPAVTITATSVTDTTKSANTTALLKSASDSGSESLLNGQYAFQLQGFDSGGNPVGIVGSLTADGTGKISGGEEDSYTEITAEADAKVDATASIYSVGPDHRGFMALAISGLGATYFRFALGSPNASNVAAIGRIIEFGQATGQASQAVGTMRLQDPASFAASQFKGNYILGVTGVDPRGANSLAGTFVADGISAISSAAYDIDRPDGIASDLPAVTGANFTCCSANGRGTMDLRINTTAFASQFVFYMVSGAEAFVGTDISVNMGGGFTGKLIGIPAGTTFSQSSLSGVSIVRQQPLSSSAPVVHIGTASADGKGTITLNDNVNNAGTFSTASTTYSYTVASNGRVTLSGGSTALVLYLYGQNQAFLVGTSRNATFGILEPQAAGPFSNASFSGAYTVGTENPPANTVTMVSGVVTADGNGDAAGTVDQSNTASLPQSQSLNFTYSFPADGVGSVGSGTTAIFISGNKLVFISNTSKNPTITVVEK